MSSIAKVIVAIHGIGSQKRCDTVRSVARQFSAAQRLPLMPLGYFSTTGGSVVNITQLKGASAGSPLERTGFAEVYWADIPRQLVTAGDTLEETKAWAHTVVSRAESLYKNKKLTQLDPDKDFSQAAGVVEEIVESVQVLENLSWIAGKMGIFQFKLADLLRDYVDDVQVFTEFKKQRDEILATFHAALDYIVKDFAKNSNGGVVPEIYIAAHSEGTVVSFLAMLQALAMPKVTNPKTGQSVDTGWIEHVHGFMTFGSPIDKHIVLWDDLWKDVKDHLACHVSPAGQVEPSGCQRKSARSLPQQIKWRNYYDFGDPVAFRLDSARALLSEQCCSAFEFEGDAKKEHDIGFSRYPLPGAAHTGYWTDQSVFDHFIYGVVWPGIESPKKPQDDKLIKTLNYGLPYLLMVCLCWLAMYILHKGLYEFLNISLLDGLEMSGNIFSLGILMAAATFMFRVPRLTRGQTGYWFGVSCVVLVVSSVPAWFLAKIDSSGEVNNIFKFLILIFAFFIGLVGLYDSKPKFGRTIQLGCGVLLVFFLAGFEAYQFRKNAVCSVWPLVLAAAAFVYLWWLAILVFDLSFIWHRYIMQQIGAKTLHSWSSGKDRKVTKPLVARLFARQRLMRGAAAAPKQGSGA